MRHQSFLQVLSDVEEELPDLLREVASWRTLDIDYECPRVERVFMLHGELRICLHRIHATDKKVLFHNHPWPCVMRVLDGIYEMGVGYSYDGKKPDIAATFLLPEASCYEMVDPHCWHYVRPITPVTYSLMVSGKPWVESPPSVSLRLKSLDESVKFEIMSFFENKYRAPKIIF